jgi:hypothetical protein
LGRATKADSVHIRWPSGIVQILHDVSPNQQLAVVETP